MVAHGSIHMRHNSPPMARLCSQVKKTMPKKRGRRGFGGPWRAYVRQRSLGTKGTSSLRRIGEEYRSAIADGTLSASVIAAGQAATIAGRHFAPKAGASAFGATGRQSARQRLGALAEGLSASTLCDTPEQSALALADALVVAGADVATSLRAARAASRRHAELQREKTANLQQKLDNFSQGAGADAVALITAGLQQPLPPTVRLHPVPSPMGLCFEVHPSTAEGVAGAVAWACASKEVSVGPSLRSFWSEAHETVDDENCAPLPERAQAMTECCKVGVCLCSEAGRLLRSLRASFLRRCKEAFPAQSDDRRSMVEGHVVVRLTDKSAAADTAFLADLDMPRRDVFLHIALLYLSPFRHTFQLLETTLPPAGEESGGRQLFVKAALGEARGSTQGGGGDCGKGADASADGQVWFATM